MPQLTVDPKTGNIMVEIIKELQRAEDLHPVWPESVFQQIAIMQEESGEAIRAVNEWHWKQKPFEDIKTEVIQTAAMCIRVLKHLENRKEN